MKYVIQIPGRALFIESWNEDNWAVIWTDFIHNAHIFELREDAVSTLNALIINGSDLIGHYRIRGLKS